MKKCILIANGKAPAKKIFPFLKNKGYSEIICADGGANVTKKLNIAPDYIIGDMDSITEETLQFYSQKINIIKIKRQNDTDVEKCLKYIIKKGYSECVLLGVIGDRLDHSFCNLGIVIKFSKNINLKIIDEQSLLTIHSGKVSLMTHPSETISIYGFNEQTKITSSGLKYKLKNASLPFGKKESTSNKATGEKILLKITGGKIFLIRDFKTIQKYDLF
jgi:thiamine pyrophosphokinase